MAMLDSARWGIRAPALARWLLGLGIAATLAANVAHGLGNGRVDAAVGLWPAVALVGSYELLMVIIRSAQTSVGAAAASSASDAAPGDGPVQEQVARAFADEVVAGVRALGARDPCPAACRAAAGAASTRILGCAGQRLAERGEITSRS
jgi:hypothetical protein